MDITHVIVGKAKREYVLPPEGPPLLDAPGGSVMHAAGGLLVWSDELGILAHIGEDYPRAWLRSIESRGVDIQGVKILPQARDAREFFAYDSDLQIARGAPVAQFARRRLPFPKALLGYQAASEWHEDARAPLQSFPSVADIPAHYRVARAVHLCPLDLAAHQQLSAVFRAAGATTLTLDPSEGYMKSARLRDLRTLFAGLTALITSEARIRSLFWGQTNDLWEMMETIGSYGCECIVARRGASGQALYDSTGRHKWEIPAYAARVADPTGAGHAFSGGFLAGFKQTYDPLQATLHGNVSASLAIEGSGAFYALSVLDGLAQARLGVIRDLVREL